MRVLFDEDLDYRLARSFPTGFDVYSTQWMGWSGMSNGDLLRAARADGFDVLVTADRSIRYQQSQPSMPVLVLQVRSTALRTCGSASHRSQGCSLARSSRDTASSDSRNVDRISAADHSVATGNPGNVLRSFP